MQKKEWKLFAGLVFILPLVYIDQWTKVLAETMLKNKADITLISGVLQLHYLENTGAAFSILENQMIFFYIITILLCGLMLWLYLSLPYDRKYRVLHILLVFLIAGALGNFCDRIRYGYVVDFIYFSLIHFPVFNVADIYVTCSVFVLFILILFIYSDSDFDEILITLHLKKKL